MFDRAIGSDFESLPAHDLLSRTPPWEVSGRPTAYAETGRQALSVIAEVLGRRGFNELIVPGFFCESMVEPFQAAGWRIGLLTPSDDLGVRRAGAWDRLHLNGARTVLLLAAYFGSAPSDEHLRAARDAAKCGAIVLEDETHRVFHPGGVDAAITFASLRKLLPVADGAYVQGDTEVIAHINRLQTGDSGRWSAMDTKRSGPDRGDQRSLFLEANRLLEDRSRLRRASVRTIEAIARLPYDDLARVRKANAAVLRAELSESFFSTISRAEPGVPSHVVVAVADPLATQRRLAKEGIYCPIHWPRPAGFPDAPWREDLISLPIDHRYGHEDMVRIARTIERVCA